MVFEWGVVRVQRDEELWLLGRMGTCGGHSGCMWTCGKMDMRGLEEKVGGMGVYLE